MPPERAGMASGVNGVARQLGTVFGIALLGSLLTNQYNAGLESKVTTLQFGNGPAQVQRAARHGLVHNLEQAGIFAASNGLRNVPPGFARDPHLPAVRQIVKGSFIEGLRFILGVAAGILAVGLLSVLLVRRSDMIDRQLGEEATVSGAGG